MNRDAVEGLSECLVKINDLLFDAVSLLTAHAGGQILDNREISSVLKRFTEVAREGLAIEKYFKALMNE